MYKRQSNGTQSQKYVSYEEFSQMYGIGMGTARKFCKEHGLVIHVGRRVLIDVARADQVFSELLTKEEA